MYGIHVFLLVLSCIIWGTTFVVVKDTVAYTNPHLIVFLRSLLASIPLGIFLLIKYPGSLLELKSIKYGALLGVFLSLSYILQSIGLIYTSSTHSAFITCTCVILVPLFLYFFFKEKIHRRGWASIAIVSVGLACLTFKPGSSFQFGDILTFCAAIIYAWQIIYSGKWVHISDALSLIFYQFFFSSLIALITTLGDKGFFGHDISLSNEAIPAILYLGLLGTLFCYFFTVYSQKYVPIITVALIFALEPIFASIVAYIFLKEQMSLVEWLGSSAIFIGVILYELSPRQMIRSILKRTLKEKRI